MVARAKINVEADDALDRASKRDKFFITLNNKNS